MTDSGPEETDTSDSDDQESIPETASGEKKDLLEEIDEQPPSQEPGPDADVDELFDEMDVGDVDGEALWDQLAGAEADAAEFDTAENPEGTVTATGESVTQNTPLTEAEDAIEEEFTAVNQQEDETDEDQEYEESLIDKRIYCQQCPHFSKPPDVSCHHDGTSIVEIREDGKFFVRDCPVVTETGPDRNQLNKDN